MTEFLYSLDRAILLFINATMSNPVGDWLWPRITDYDKLLPVRIVLLLVWLWLVIRGGTRGRTAALLIIPLLFISDKITNTLIKEFVGRLRPCHQIDGVTIVQGLHMLVDCGPGKSFPSSHAVNNFAVGTLLAYYYRQWSWAFYCWAALVAISRCAVGVHYPSDILGGAVIGVTIGLTVVWLWTTAQRRFLPSLSPEPSRSENNTTTHTEGEGR